MAIALNARKQQDQLVCTIGKRLRQGRHMCNMSLTYAAKKLGYANPSKLSKVEHAYDTHSVPLWLIERAAKLYDVSIDFLFGRSDDFETSSRMYIERETAQWVFHAWETARQRDMQVVRGLVNRIESIGQSTVQLHDTGGQLKTAMQRFVELNPEFETMRGSARVLSAVNTIYDHTQAARNQLSRFKLHCHVAGKTCMQLTLPGLEQAV